MPPSLPDVEQWSAQPTAKGLITPEERHVQSDFARFTDLSVQVDNFPPDLDAAAEAEKRWRMAAKDTIVEA